MIVLAGCVEPTFGRALLAPLGDDAGGVGPVAKSDLEHLLGRCHLEVQRQVDLGHQPVDVLVGDVPPVLAQVRGDAVGAGAGGDVCGAHRVGMIAAARVPDRRDMVDIDAEAKASAQAAARLPGFTAGIAASSGGTRIRFISRNVDPDQRIEGNAKVGLPDERSTSAASATTSPPAARTASIASREERPVVTTSSTISTLVAGLDREAAAKLERRLAVVRGTSPACPARGPFHGR